MTSILLMDVPCLLVLFTALKLFENIDQGSDDENPPPPPPPPPQTPTQQALHTVSTIKLPILKKGVDWIGHAEDEQENFALIAYNNSGSDTKVTSCSKECVESYAKLKKLYDEQREQLGDASIEIQAYTQALKKVEAQLVAHTENQTLVQEKIIFKKLILDDKTDVLTYHKKLLAEAMSTRDKSGLGYGDQVHEGVLSYENEVFKVILIVRSRNYMPLGPDREVDNSIFTYGPKQSKTSKSDTQTSNFDSCESNSSVETLESVPEPVVVEPKVVSQPKVWPFNRTTTPKAKFSNQKVNTAEVKAVSAVGDMRETAIKPSQVVIGDPKDITGTKSPNTIVDQALDNPQRSLKNKGIVDSGVIPWHLTSTTYLYKYQDQNGGPVAFGGIKYCDKKPRVHLSTDTECFVLSSDFKLPDENQVLLRIPRQNNMYSFNIENIVPSGGLACLIAKATFDESNKWP
ncbi:hypothetical protein Tco_0843359 [Tanacetum coccineum]|uniref:Uncharacterized protein n=1 Tax=Tanacetum coccineum TaxID=301880 RepID=A0ABQ5B432_9ASTR